MSSCHEKDTDRLRCIGLCQGHLKQCHICITNVITERMTLNDSCHTVNMHKTYAICLVMS